MSLTAAASRSADDRIHRLLSLGCSPLDATETGCVHATCRARAVDCLRLLLDAEANPNLQLEDGAASPLLVAVSSGAISCVNLLLARGASPTLAAADGATPLYAAILLAPEATPPAAIVQLLLEKKAQPDVPARSGAVPLHVACLRGDDESTALLIDANCILNVADRLSGATPLIVACGRNQTRCVELLLAARADARIASHDGTTPLAAAAAHAECVGMIKKAIADEDAEVAAALTATIAKEEANAPSSKPASPTSKASSTLSASAKVFVPAAVVVAPTPTVPQQQPTPQPSPQKPSPHKSPIPAAARNHVLDVPKTSKFFAAIGWGDGEDDEIEPPATGIFDGWSPAASSASEGEEEEDEDLPAVGEPWWASLKHGRRPNSRGASSSPAFEPKLPGPEEETPADSAARALLNLDESPSAFMARIGWLTANGEATMPEETCVTMMGARQWQHEPQPQPQPQPVRAPLQTLHGDNGAQPQEQEAAASPQEPVPFWKQIVMASVIQHAWRLRRREEADREKQRAIEQQQQPQPSPPTPPPKTGVKRVTLLKADATTKLGLVLTGADDAYPIVNGLREGGLAAQSGGGLLKVGDVLLSINGEPVLGHAQATAMLREAVGALELELREEPTMTTTTGEGLRIEVPPCTTVGEGEDPLAVESGTKAQEAAHSTPRTGSGGRRRKVKTAAAVQ